MQGPWGKEMSSILGAAMLVAAYLVLQMGHSVLEGMAARSYAAQCRVADCFAIAFTGLFGTGFILLLLQMLQNFDLLHMAQLAAALIATVYAVRYAGRLLRRRSARVPL